MSTLFAFRFLCIGQDSFYKYDWHMTLTIYSDILRLYTSNFFLFSYFGKFRCGAFFPLRVCLISVIFYWKEFQMPLETCIWGIQMIELLTGIWRYLNCSWQEFLKFLLPNKTLGNSSKYMLHLIWPCFELHSDLWKLLFLH